jgi:cellulose synthase (UDP-forming)
MYLIIPYLYLWTGVQPASMRFGEFATVGGPVAVIGMVLYLVSQRWLADPERERGFHWRGLSLKVACWPVYLAGSALAVIRAHIPYIPTAKEAHRGRFLTLAWPHLIVAVAYLATVGWTLYRRLVLTPEGSLFLTSEAVWGMVGFATMALAMAGGGIFAAWESRSTPSGTSWDLVDLDALAGGTPTPDPPADAESRS